MKKIVTIALLAMIITLFGAKPAIEYTQTENVSFRVGFWDVQNAGFSEASRGIKYLDAVDENVAWATAYDGSGSQAVIQEFTKTTNGGQTWTMGTMSGLSGLTPAMICALDDMTAYVPMFRESGTNAQGIYKTTDGGQTWERQESAAYNAADGGFPNVVHFFNENDGFCQGDPVDGYYELYTTDDGGENWVRVPTENIPAPLSGEWGIIGYYDAVGDNIWFGTQKSRVFYSTDKGHTWNVSDVPLGSSKYIDIVFADAMNGLAQDKTESSTGTIAKTTDGGETWELVNHTGNCFTNDIVHIPGTAETYVSTGAATDFSGASYSFDGGETWTDFQDTNGIQFLASDWVDTEHGWAGGFSDQMTPSLGGMNVYVGNLSTSIGGDIVPNKAQILTNYPNPFNPSTIINYTLASQAKVNLTIYDANGVEITTLVNGRLNAGEHRVEFDAGDLTSGIYYYNLIINGKSYTNKMVLIK